MMAREIAAKIVFYGPGLSGKTTTLKKIHESVKPAHRGEMMSLPTENDRTLFFDFVPVKVERVGDCSVRLALYTVPGQVFYNATRRLVLQGADGVVFVADSQPEAMDSNLESLRNLEENLLEQGIRLERFPLVLQYNKRDIPKSLPVAEMRAALNPQGRPDFETSATSGRGVLDALKAITRLVIKDLRTKRVVPSPRPDGSAASVPSLGMEQGGLEGQIHQHLDSGVNIPVYVPPEERHAPEPVATPAWTHEPAMSQSAPPLPEGQPPLGPAAALAPTPLLDYARAADLAFAAGDHAGCVRASQEAIRRALTYTGEASSAAQAYLLGVDGGDLLRLQGLATRPVLRVDDAAFALYVLMQALTRLTAAGLASEE